ncbi:MAG: RNA methyltransferase [Actinomycetaceae bacterium]|nr:RNA methyltransferase [Actinomycetaceae bacterium]
MRLTPIRDGQLEKIRKLYKRENRRKFSQTIVEGPHSVRELLVHASFLVRDVYMTPDFSERHPGVYEIIKNSDVYVHSIRENQLEKITRDSQGVFAHINIPQQWSVKEAMNNVDVGISLARISDPGNLGTIIRSADAAGVDAIFICDDSVDVFSPKVIRSCVGSLFHIPVVTDCCLQDVIDRAKELNINVFAADGYGDVSLYECLISSMSEDSSVKKLNLRAPTLWVMGNEAHGFEGIECEGLDARISIPIYGQAESLNVAIASSIVMYISALLQNNER